MTAFLAIVVISVTGLLLFFWTEQREVGKVDRPEADQVPVEQLRGTAEGAYVLVEPVARRWAADARLVRARGNWPAGADFAPAQGTWSFLFYSPQQQAVAFVVADGDGARVVSENETEQRLNPVAFAGWQVDSPEVVEQFMSDGGLDFIAEHGEASLILALNRMEEPVWTATLSATETNALFRLQIDPDTGQIVQ